MKKPYKYISSIFFSVIEIIIVWAVLSNVEYSGDSTIIAGLVIIYASIRSIGLGLGAAVTSLIPAFAVELLKIKERIRKDGDTEAEREQLEMASEKVTTANYKMYIRSVGVSIIYILGLFALFK